MGKEAVVTESAALIVSERVLLAVLCVGLALSVTVTLRVDVPAVVGVPEMTPVAALRLNPAGRPVIGHA